MLFVSHANPEDNEFSLWLALRLAAEGYPVWCDLTQLLGGERFWSDIETAIRDRSAKFLFVLSRSSNQKNGPLDELHLALSTARSKELEDFVIPLWIDDLPSSEFNVRLGPLNAIRFQEGWAEGLAQLLRKLRASGVEVDSRFGPAAVGAWWLENVSASRGLKNEAERLTSNFYGLLDAHLHVYRPAPAEGLPPMDPAVPCETSRGLLATFAPPDVVLADHPSLQLVDSIHLDGNARTSPSPPAGWGYGDLRRSITALLNLHWRWFVERCGLRHYSFAHGQPAVYHTLGGLGLARVPFPSPAEPTLTRARQLMGYKTVASGQGEAKRRYWHFGLEARAETELAYGYVMKPRVVFSDDGHSVWNDDNRLHRARRSQCKGWWNDKWRDLIQAAVTVLRGDSEVLDLSAAGAPLQVAAAPTIVTTSVSYSEPSTVLDDAEDLDEDERPTLEVDDDDGDWDA